MDWTLIVNPGSSSKKYALYHEGCLVSTIKYEKTADGFAQCVRIDNQEQKCNEVETKEYETALQSAVETMVALGVLPGITSIGKVGVRVVAPGSQFMEHREVTEDYIAQLKATEAKAPLHISPILSEVVAAQQVLAHAKLIAVSDSAFHQTIPAWRRQYSLKGTKERDIFRFGYHGLSAASVIRRSSPVFKNETERVVVLHVGNGVSVIGVRDGVSQFASMGYTPGSGLMMGSRAGDIDPGALIEMLTAESLSGREAHEYVQTQGGFVGRVGVRDIRSVLSRMAKGDSEAQSAMTAFVSGIAEMVAAAATAIGGVDALIMTGTAVERNADVRRMILKPLNWCGVLLDETINESVYGKTQLISRTDSQVAVAVIPTDEMGEMARVCASF